MSRHKQVFKGVAMGVEGSQMEKDAVGDADEEPQARATVAECNEIPP